MERFLHEQGFYTYSAAYHEIIPEKWKKTLGRIDSITAFYIRGRSDQIAIRGNPPLVFEWEAKTHKASNLHDMLFEALPFCFHVLHARQGVRCLYVYRDPDQGYDRGFWVGDPLPVRVILIPPIWSDHAYGQFRKVFKAVLPNVTIRRSGPIRSGSGDPFLIVDEWYVQRLPSWKQLILTELDEAAKGRIPWRI